MRSEKLKGVGFSNSLAICVMTGGLFPSLASPTSTAKINFSDFGGCCWLQVIVFQFLFFENAV